ncbi:MAG: hypothetical protein OEZ01_12775 [Candidatus Heimdallarchaeota archaeon]|nr:hypothetical protein [Candidatus Heimdallarchaeota archaeon]
MLNEIKNNVIEFVIVGILLGGVFYAATTAWKNEEKLGAIGEDIKSIKKSMISLLLDDKPNKSSIAKDLVSDISLIDGINNFKAGEYKTAYSIWRDSAIKGNRDSIYAIAVANDALKFKLARHELTSEEKLEIQKLLKDAPKIKEKGGVYFFAEME